MWLIWGNLQSGNGVTLTFGAVWVIFSGTVTTNLHPIRFTFSAKEFTEIALELGEIKTIHNRVIKVR